MGSVPDNGSPPSLGAPETPLAQIIRTATISEQMFLGAKSDFDPRDIRDLDAPARSNAKLVDMPDVPERQKAGDKAEPKAWDRDDVEDFLVDEAGFDKRELAMLWESAPWLRDARTQKVLLYAARHHAAQARLKEIKPTRPAKPLVSGAQSHHGYDADSLAAIAASGNMEAFIAKRNKGIKR